MEGISKELTTGSREVAAFLQKTQAIRSVVERTPRLLFALDATASREPTWEQATRWHREMFRAASGQSLAIQLAYYRGLSDFEVSPWLTRSEELLAHMSAVHCVGGATQIRRLLRHYLQSGSASTPVRALVFIGDAVEEPTAQLVDLAGQCRLRQRPLFLFQEGRDPLCTQVFEQLAKISGGAYARFDHHSADYLRDLLGAVARFATGGAKALTSSGSDSDKLLLSQLSKHQ